MGKSHEIRYLNSRGNGRMENMDSNGRIWLENLVFFVGVHLIGVVATFFSAPQDCRCWILFYCNWQVAMFGITLGKVFIG